MASDIENTPPITDEDVERDTFGAERLANQRTTELTDADRIAAVAARVSEKQLKRRPIMDQRLDGFAIKSAGKYIGLDRSSGGYPYIANGMRDIFIWDSEEKAKDYINVFRGGSSIGGVSPASTWRVVRVVLIEV